MTPQQATKILAGALLAGFAWWASVVWAQTQDNRKNVTDLKAVVREMQVQQRAQQTTNRRLTEILSRIVPTPRPGQ